MHTKNFKQAHPAKNTVVPRSPKRAGASVAGAIGLCLFGTNAVMAQDSGSDDLSVTWSGTHRTFYEYLDNPFRPGRTEKEGMFSLRTNLVAKIEKGGFEVVAELNDTRAYGADDTRNLTTAIVNALEPVQYFVRYRFKDAFGAGSNTAIQAGRFTYDMGSRRVIGRQRHRNSMNSFVGAKVTWKSAAGNSLDAFWLLPSRLQPRDSVSLDGNKVKHDQFDTDLRLSGVFFHSPKVIEGSIFRSYAVWLKQKDDPAELETTNRRLFTIGAQLQKKRSANSFDYDIEGAVQRGKSRASSNPLDVQDQKVRAGFLHAAVGYSLAKETGLNVAATYDIATGDKDPNDNRNQRYDPIFGPIRGDLGPTGLFALVHRSNISAPGLRLTWKPKGTWDLIFHWQAVWLQSATDQFARTRVRDASGASGTFAGHQLRLRSRIPVKKGVKLELGAVSFQNGEFFDNAPNATGNGNPLFGYAMVTLSF